MVSPLVEALRSAESVPVPDGRAAACNAGSAGSCAGPSTRPCAVSGSVIRSTPAGHRPHRGLSVGRALGRGGRPADGGPPARRSRAARDGPHRGDGPADRSELTLPRRSSSLRARRRAERSPPSGRPPPRPPRRFPPRHRQPHTCRVLRRPAPCPVIHPGLAAATTRSTRRPGRRVSTLVHTRAVRSACTCPRPRPPVCRR